jgi:hypothetical protein
MTEPNEQQRKEVHGAEIPIRVIGFALERNEFTEDTKTVTIQREGATIKLSQKVAPRSEVRIINLKSYKEADFRIVSPARMDGLEPTEWSVEYLESGRNIWGIEFPPRASSDELVGVTIECRVCHKQSIEHVSIMSLEALNAMGIVALDCEHCHKLTYWNYVDLARYPMQLPPADLVAPPMPEKVEKKGVETRKARRLGMKLPILVRNAKGGQETGKTDDLSKGGVAVSLTMDLVVGDQVTVVCPYSGHGNEPSQKAEVRRRGAFTFNDKRQYGLKYIT